MLFRSLRLVISVLALPDRIIAPDLCATDPAAAVAVAHKSGAMILSGSASTLITNLSTTSSTVVTALSTPAALTAVGVSVLAVGGAVYMCSGDAPEEDVPAE